MTQLPVALEYMLRAWNEKNPELIRGHLEKSLAANIIFADPSNLVEGIDAFEIMVKEFLRNFPQARCEHSSGYDSHHNRYRYQWTVHADENNSLVGYDVTVLNSDNLVERVEGFFGEIPEQKK